MSDKKAIITLSFVKNLIKELSNPDASDELKASKKYCFSIAKGKQIFYRDLKLTGFAIRVTTHSLVYTVEKKMPNGIPTRVTIGDHGLYTPETARAKANELLLEMANGINPNDEKRRKKKEALTDLINKSSIPTLLDAYEVYKQAKILKPNTITTYDRCIHIYLMKWQNLKLTEISKKMVLEQHATISQFNKSHANVAMKCFSAIYNYHRKFLLDENDQLIIQSRSPVEILYKNNAFNKLKSRKNHIRREQQADWAFAIANSTWIGNQNDDEHGYTNQDFLFTFALTGMRRNEIEKLEWSDVDLKYGTLTIVNPKNGQDLLLPFGDTLWHIFKERYKRSNGCRFVFPSRNGLSHVKDKRYIRYRIQQETGIEFTYHDLRRTFASVANRCGIGIYTVKTLINHAFEEDSNDITAEYTQIAIEDLRDAMNKIENAILSAQVKSLILNRCYY